MAVPNGKGLQKPFAVSEPEDFESGFAKPVMPLEHLNCFTNKTLKKMARNAGLKPIVMASGDHRYGFKEMLKSSVFADIYKFYFGTNLYFEKR